MHQDRHRQDKQRQGGQSKVIVGAMINASRVLDCAKAEAFEYELMASTTPAAVKTSLKVVWGKREDFLLRSL